PARIVRGWLGWTAKPKTRLSDHRPVRTCRQLSPPSVLTQAPVPTVPTQIVKLSATTLSSLSTLTRLPAGVRDVDHHAVGAGPFHLEIAMAASRHLHIPSRLFFHPLAARALDIGRGLIEVLDLKAEVMNAAVVGAVGADVGGFLCLPVQDRQIDVAIGQKHRTVRGAPDLLQAERLFVES